MRSLTCSDSSPPEDQMAFLLSNGSLLSRLRSTQHHPQEQWALKDSIGSGHRGFHIELGAREKALLEEDPALKRFKTYKKSVWRLKRVGDVLTIVVVAGCCYEIYVRTVMKKAAVEAAKASGDQP